MDNQHNPNLHHMALPQGYYLEQYRIEGELGHGGFGITYRAVDSRLDRQVAIKEYLPRDLAFRYAGQTVQAISQTDHEMFEWGLERFLDEARTLAKFNHPNIVQVLQFFRANDTAYLVMEYCDGEPLDRVLDMEGRLQPDQVQQITTSLLDALTEFHKLDVIHRDIKPANIYIKADGTPVVLDFGSARQAVGGRSRSMTAVVSPHYAAFEQYSTRGKQGPWTDLYGLAATLYHCITGERPPEATDRIEEDVLQPIDKYPSIPSYPVDFLQAITQALVPLSRDRLQTAAEWQILVGINTNKLLDVVKKQPQNTAIETNEIHILDPNQTPDLSVFLSPPPNVENPERDPFETEEEYRQRIEDQKESIRKNKEALYSMKWYIGEAHLIKEEYCIKTNRFPLVIKNSPDWVIPYLEKKAFSIYIERHNARDLYNKSSHWPAICTITPNTSFTDIHIKNVNLATGHNTSDNIKITEKNIKYLDHRDGTITDIQTGLQWMRCSLGQRLDNDTCVGEAEGFIWQEALDAAVKINQKGGYAGHRDWRMPTIGELKSLILKTNKPTIDILAFPNTPNSWFWSSSTNDSSPASAWNVDFNRGHVTSSNTGHRRRVRLVRGGK